MTKALQAIAALALSTGIYSTSASTIDILWYTGGTESSGPGSYEAAINNLVAQEENPLFNTASVNTWNVTFWTGGAMPAGSYDVLVGASAIGGWSSYPSYGALTSAVNASSFGSRVLLTGQDADWHYINTPGSANFNGPAGFLIDAINWAGSGTGMGGVFLNTGLEGSMFGGPFGILGTGSGDNTVNIPPAYASFPINEDLTSAGLSSWNTSAHESFNADPTLWASINTGGGGEFVTVVTKETADGGTGGVPEPTTVFGGMALAGLAASRVLRRKTA